MKACLFDHDGTLADSEVTFTRSMQAGFREVLGLELSVEEYVEHCVGVSVEDWQKFLLESAGGDTDLRNKLWRSIEAHCLIEFKDGVSLFPGTLKTLDLLDAAERPAALVTNSSMGHLNSMHPKGQDVGGFLKRFASIVTPERAKNPKPHPEMYALAARELNIHPSDCFAFEDSRPGAQAAVDAGCVTIVLVNAHNDHVDFPKGTERLPLEALPEFVATQLG